MAETGNNKRINLLPGDLERRRDIIKRAVAESSPEYTEPAVNGAGKSNGDLLRSKGAPKKGFLSRLFHRLKPASPPPQPTPKSKDLPAGAPAPSALFKDAPSAKSKPVQALAKPTPERPKEKKFGFLRRLFSKKVAPKKIEPDFLKPSIIRPERTVESRPPAPKPAPKPPVKKAPPPPPPPAQPVPPPPAPVPSAPPPSPIKPLSPPLAAEPPAVPAKSKPAEPPAREPSSSAKASEDKPLDVNLLSEEYRAAFVPARGKAVLAWSLGLAALVVLLGYGLAYLYQVRSERAIEGAVTSASEIEQAVATFEDLADEDQELAKKTAALAALFSDHLSFTAFLESLERATIPEVTYTSIAVSRQGMVSISGQTPSYTALARQLTVYEEDTPWIQDVNMSAASLIRDELGKEAGVGFDVTLTVDPAIFEPAT